MSLIAIIILLLFIGVSALVSSSLIGTGNIGGSNVIQGGQALAAAQAGEEWYMEKLQHDTDWTNEVDMNNNALSPGSPALFDIDVTSVSATRVIFTSTGRVVNPENLTIRRRMSVTAWKLSPAFQFALYQGGNPGATLSIRTTSVINGDMWSSASVDVQAGNSVTNGTVYVPTGQTVSGTGTFVSKIMPLPSLTTPGFTTTTYTTLMNSFDTIIDAANLAGAGDVNQSTNLVLAGNTVQARDFNTSGTITISGNGTIVAWRNMQLHTGAGGSLTVSPSGGNIRFIAGRNLTVGRAAGSLPTITMNTGDSGKSICILYSRAQTATSQMVDILGSSTLLHGVKIYARRRIVIESSADLDQTSLLYVERASSTTSNQIDITDSGTSVAGSIISLGQNTENLRIRNSASATGLVFSNDTGGTGRLELNSCTVTGSVVGNLYRSGGNNDRVITANVTYNSTVIPDPPPEGFDNFVMKKPDSWDGL